MILKSGINVAFILSCILFVGVANAADSIGNYVVLIGIGERNYSHQIVGWDIIDKRIIDLPLIKDSPNFLCLKTRNSDEYLSPEIVILYPEGQDTDVDGLSDKQELLLGSNPKKYDTDQDGFSDGEEWVLWGEKSTEDFDGDGLSNIIDPDSLSSGLLDRENPDIETIGKVIVINDDKKKLLALGIFDKEIKTKKIVINKKNYLTFSWKSNDEKVDGYRIYYKRIGKNGERYRDGLSEGSPPIEVGNTTKFLLLPPNKIGVYEFCVTAFIGMTESDCSAIISVNTAISNNEIKWGRK